MLPTIGIPLQHDLLWRILWIEVGVSKKCISHSYRQSRVGLFDEMLTQASCRSSVRKTAAINTRRRRRDKLPAPVVTAVTRRLRSSGDFVINPHIIQSFDVH